MPDKNLSGICGYEFFGKFMQPKILSKRIFLIVAFTGFALFLSLLFYFIPKSSIHGGSAHIIENAVAFQKQEQKSATLGISVDAVAYSNQEQASVGLPVRLKIPSINVDSAVVYVGLTSDGAMDAPKDPDEAAWFNLGPRPGEIGSAAIAGHYDWKNNTLAVFNNLHKLRKDDKISVEDEKGVATTFVVREIRTYGKDEVAFDVFRSDDGKAHLNLITCAGVWDKIQKSYSNRIIVFTDKE